MKLGFIIAVALVLLAAPAVAQGYNRPDIVRGLCRKDGYDEFSLLAKEQVSKAAEGTLFRTRVRTFRASQQGRASQGEEDGYVFCSSTRPAIISEQDGKALAFLLAPYAQKEARENTNFYALYFAMCHGLETAKTAARDWRGAAQSLGYDVPLAHSRP